MDTTTLDARAARLRRARLDAGFPTAKAAAVRHGFNYNTYSQHERGLVGFGRAAADYAAAYHVSEGWLITGEENQSRGETIPLLGTAAGAGIGAWRAETEPLDRLTCPPGLVGIADAYAILVKGNSMSPEHKDGALRFVNPVKRPVAGDTVIVQQQIIPDGPIEAFIKRFLRETESEIVTEQLEPFGLVRFPKRTVKAVHKVPTLNELFGL